MDREESERAQRRRQKLWEREHRLALEDSVKQLLATEHGRRFIHWLLQIGRAIGDNPFAHNALVTSFNCGEQNIGQQIMAKVIEVSPDGFLQVLKDEHARSERYNAAAAESDAGTDSAEPGDT